ncbi:lipid transferase CIDEB-like [Zonotrichia albicollis]|uniref:lipid transferase CIDEB-like n=1 Tax=Zonotrichia albicollis TaxID=44394 RepID=UPI003D80BA85
MEALRSVSRLLFGSAHPGPAPAKPRPFWVSPAPGGEGRPRGVLAATLGELREQAGSVLGLPRPPVLALAEDGTLIEDEEFFGTLPPHTALQALGEGQRWEPPEPRPSLAPPPAPPPAPELFRLSLLGPAHGSRGRLQLRLREQQWELGGIGANAALR